MSIDARVDIVIVKEDGSGFLSLIDRPKRWTGDHTGCCGQGALIFDAAPEEVTYLNGMDIWGGSSEIVLGDLRIAERLGYTRIRFVDRDRFLEAIRVYNREKRQ
jgi:hypothetical protein